MDFEKAKSALRDWGYWLEQELTAAQRDGDDPEKIELIKEAIMKTSRILNELVAKDFSENQLKSDMRAATAELVTNPKPSQRGSGSSGYGMGRRRSGG